tara:strand:- start:420 stop:683 length:264 start_codon:yes stop_codon:yes gene_type:complete
MSTYRRTPPVIFSLRRVPEVKYTNLLSGWRTQNIDYKKLLEDFLELQRAYQFERRTLMTRERYKAVAKCDPQQGLNINNGALNEPLV